MNDVETIRLALANKIQEMKDGIVALNDVTPFSISLQNPEIDNGKKYMAKAAKAFKRAHRGLKKSKVVVDVITGDAGSDDPVALAAHQFAGDGGTGDKE